MDSVDRYLEARIDREQSAVIQQGRTTHAMVTDGAFAPDGTFIPLPLIEAEPFEKRWQRKVFDLLLDRGKIDESLVTQMSGWQHSGFGRPEPPEPRC